MVALTKRDIEMIFRAETDAAQRPVNELSSDVRKLRQTLEDLAKASTKTDKSLDELASTTRNLEKAQEELGTARTLLTQLNAQQVALSKAEDAAAKAATQFQKLKTQVEGAEAPTKRLTTSMEAAERRMGAANQRLEEQRGIYKDVKASIEGIIGPVDNLQDAFRTVAVAQREISQGLAAAKGSVAAFKAEIADTTVEATRLAQVDAFRKLASDSIAADSAADRIKAGLDGSTTSARRLQDAIFSLVNPAQAAANSIEGIEEKLSRVEKTMSGGKLSVNQWNELNNELQSIQANLVRASAQVDKFTSQQTRVDAASTAYETQAAKVRQLAASQITAETDVKALTAAIQREESELKQLGAALDRETAKLKEFGNALKQVGVNSNQLPAAIQRIEAAATRAAPAIQRVSNTMSPSGRKGFLGLDPFQLQNLSFQVNDVFTSLASGISPMQTLAQQGGQIVQLFPGMISGLARMLPILAPLAIGFTVFAGAIGEANTQIETLRAANTVIASLGDTNGYDAKKFQQIVSDFRAIGVSAEEATEAAKTFVTEGLNPAAVDDYVIAAKNLADVQGIDVKTATEELTKAFTAGATEVLALDDKYHFLTETQRTNLEASKDTKNEYNEVNKAFTQLYTKMQDGANAAKGPMTDATNTLRNAWRGLLNTFADTGVIESVKDYLADAVLGFAYLINVAKKAGAAFGAANDAYNSAGGGFVGLLHAGAALSGASAGMGGILNSAREETRKQYESGARQFTAPQANRGADAGAGSAGRQRDREAQAKKDRTQAERDRKKAARDAEADAKRRQREAEQLAKQYANEQDQLTAALSRFTIEAIRGTQAPLDAQLQLARQSVDEQFKAIEDRLQEFRAKFGADRPINGMSQTEFAAAIQRQKDQITLAKQLGVYESNINDLLKSRDTRLKDIKEQQDAGLLSAQGALDKTYEVTSTMGPLINGAIESARAFIATLTPSNETQAMLDKFERIQSQGGANSAGTINTKQAISGLEVNEKKINDLFVRRAALIQAANNLYDAGVLNYTEKESQIKLAYESSNQAILAALQSAREYIDANRAAFGDENADLVSGAIAQLYQYNSELKYTDELTRNVKQSAQDAIAGGLMGMFDALAQGIANVITGSGSFMDILKGLGRAALQFAADFTKAIAQAIIQVYALRVAKSLIGGFHGGGIVGDYGGGQMKLARNIGPSLDLSSVPRYHNGTPGAGLEPNETLAVLQKGEKVQTEEQQAAEKRRLMSARKGSGSGSGIRQVLAFGDDQVAQAMAGPAGEDVVVTHIRRNKTRLRQELGIG